MQQLQSQSYFFLGGRIHPRPLALRPQMPVWILLKVVENYGTKVLGCVLLLSILISSSKISLEKYKIFRPVRKYQILTSYNSGQK